MICQWPYVRWDIEVGVLLTSYKSMNLHFSSYKQMEEAMLCIPKERKTASLPAKGNRNTCLTKHLTNYFMQLSNISINLLFLRTIEGPHFSSIIPWRKCTRLPVGEHLIKVKGEIGTFYANPHCLRVPSPFSYWMHFPFISFSIIHLICIALFP